MRVHSITAVFVFVSSWAGGPRIAKSGLGRRGAWSWHSGGEVLVFVGVLEFWGVIRMVMRALEIPVLGPLMNR